LEYLMKMKSTLVMAALVLVAGCNKAPEATAEAPADTAAAPAAVAAAGGAAVDTGVPECDAYLTKVMACIKDKVPAAQRKMMEDGIAQSKASWAAVTDKTALAAQCKAASDQAKATYGAMGCTL
jgi:hypothetical protein